MAILSIDDVGNRSPESLEKSYWVLGGCLYQVVSMGTDVQLVRFAIDIPELVLKRVRFDDLVNLRSSFRPLCDHQDLGWVMPGAYCEDTGSGNPNECFQVVSFDAREVTLLRMVRGMSPVTRYATWRSMTLMSPIPRPFHLQARSIWRVLDEEPMG